jgi:hypothetical protein
VCDTDVTDQLSSYTGLYTADSNDACDLTVAITFSDLTTPGTCTGTYSVRRTWTATDDCGNTATCSGTIVVQGYHTTDDYLCDTDVTDQLSSYAGLYTADSN